MNPSSKIGEVLVLDNEGKFLAPTNSANARRLLKSGEAKVKSKQPFTIILTKQVTNPNIERRISLMRTNFFNYFKEETPVYIQNVSNPIGVISLEFKSPGGDIIPYRVPANRNPIELTNYVPFGIIKTSGSFMSFLQPSAFGPARLQLLTGEEYWKFYEDKQKMLGEKSAQKVAEEAQDSAHNFNNSVVSKALVVSEDDARPSKEEKYVLEPEVNPRVIAVCQQLDPENTNSIGPKEAIDIFSSLDLAIIDCDYILGHTFDHIKKENSLVRKWTLNRQQQFNSPKDTGIIKSEAVTQKSATSETKEKKQPPVRRKRQEQQ